MGNCKFLWFWRRCIPYNNVLIIGRKGRKKSWIGPNVILDGSSGLEIGEYVTVSAGVQIYTHNSVDWSISKGKEQIVRKPTKIGSGVYIGPNSIIQNGVNIGDHVIIDNEFCDKYSQTQQNFWK